MIHQGSITSSSESFGIWNSDKITIFSGCIYYSLFPFTHSFSHLPTHPAGKGSSHSPQLCLNHCEKIKKMFVCSALRNGKT